METLYKISVACSILAFISAIFLNLYLGQHPKLESIVILTFAVYALPKIIILIIFPFFPSLMNSIQDMKVQLSIMGLILLFVNIKTIIEIVCSTWNN